jgi:NAD-dependent dihydropyrimidine dehydrogenase PreA subunit/DNA-binding Lrp family transcriptional regulator
MSLDEKYKQIAMIINTAGGTPFPVGNTLIKILKNFIDEDEISFIMAFKREKSQAMEQLKKSSKLSEEEILKKVEILAKKGIIFNQPNRQGIMVYRLLPLVNVGTFEYTFMNKLEINERNKEIADLFTQLFSEVRTFVQNNYDTIMSSLQKRPPVDRTVPSRINKATGKDIEITINEELEVPKQQIIPSQRIEEIIEKFDEIAVAHCFCRHHRDLEGKPCQQTDIRENCFTFGKSARHIINQGFGRSISKEEALKIMKEAEEAGLVHKAYHPNFDITKEETSICNCCKCCCGNSLQNSIGPMINATNYLSKVNQDLCIGCGTCVEKCINDAIYLNENKKAERIEAQCIGCGICAHFCPENAIYLEERPRIVRIIPSLSS